MQHITRVNGNGIKTAARFALLAVAATALSGCIPIAVSSAVVGTTAVIAQERTVGDAVDDIAIRAKIESKLLGRSIAMSQNVDTDVIEGRVLLTGGVPTPEHRIEASRIAWSTPNVVEVLNEIEVTGKSTWSSYPKDAWISTKLSMRLLGDKSIRDVNYSIETVRGTVYLIGIAQDKAEYDRVLRHARSISGVRRIINHVQLKDDPSRTGTQMSLHQPGDNNNPVGLWKSSYETGEQFWEQ